MTDRITRLRVRGFRCLADVTLDLSGLTVLIGENGSGKSSLVEVCEVLRFFGGRNASMQDFLVQHPSVVRAGWNSLELIAQFSDPRDPSLLPIQYSLEVEASLGRSQITKEMLSVGPRQGEATPLVAIDRDRRGAKVFDQQQRALVRVDADPSRPLVSSFGSLPHREGDLELRQHAIERTARALQGVEVHVPFEVLPHWVSMQRARKSEIRESTIVQPAHRLDLLGTNLINVLHRLKNEEGGEHWMRTIEYIRLGLGRDVDDVILNADPSGGKLSLAIRFRSLSTAIPASALSDGVLSYLAFVALLRLPNPSRSLLVFDEMERHLHPGLLARVFGMFESLTESAPVLITTHSDRILDWVQEPAKSVVLCELNEAGETRLLRPNEELLAAWLKDYQGLGELRSTGLQSAVMEESDEHAGS